MLVPVGSVWAQDPPETTPPAAPVDVHPTTVGLPGGALWTQVLGWVMQAGLYLSVAAIVVGGAGGWLSARMGNMHGSELGKTTVVSGLVGALLTGLAPAMVNGLFDAGNG